jgi:hypothetical protein
MKNETNWELVAKKAAKASEPKKKGMSDGVKSALAIAQLKTTAAKMTRLLKDLEGDEADYQYVCNNNLPALLKDIESTLASLK